MRAIDHLLHRFHWELKNTPTRPLAVNFIDLRLWDVVRFLITLAYPEDDPEARRQYETWLANAQKSGWYENELKEFEGILAELAGGSDRLHQRMQTPSFSQEKDGVFV